jgi:hypothetical protein
MNILLINGQHFILCYYKNKLYWNQNCTKSRLLAMFADIRVLTRLFS